MKILHTADWHLGTFRSPVKDGVNLRSEDTKRCLDELIKAAKEEQPDFVLISGDVFHTERPVADKCCEEIVTATEYIRELAAVSEHVVVMRGTPNHDGLGQFHVLNEIFYSYPNVHIVTTPQVLSFDKVDIAVLPGFGSGVYRTKHPGLSKEEENAALSEELGNIVNGLKAQCTPEKLSILMAHYTVPGCNTESGQTMMLTQFEPMILPESLLAANYNLVTLGHIHRPQQVLSHQWYYSGAINAMNFNDEGQERGFWIHYFNKTVLIDSKFFKTPIREFKTILLDDDDINQINMNAVKMVATHKWCGKIDGKIVRIHYNCTEENAKALNKAVLEKELLNDGAFMIWEILPEKIEEFANRTELSNTTDPEANLIKYLEEKQFSPERIQELILKARPVVVDAEAIMPTVMNTGIFEPIEISVRNYRNYEEETFNFEDITFCTINGQNGAGKSSLFMDAIVDCLYEKPREGDRNKTGWIRNDKKARSGFIMFTFRIGEKKYRITRTRARSGKGTLNLAQFIDGDWRDCSKERCNNTQQEIIDILGMDSFTFKSCALIMQDQYGLFLQAEPEDRVEVLGTLLGLGMYPIMEKIVMDKAKVNDAKNTELKKELEIHNNTILSLGNPNESLRTLQEELIEYENTLQATTDERDKKKLLLINKQEAAQRRDRLLIEINTLLVKKSATEQSKADQQGIIDNSNVILDNRLEIEEKVVEYNIQVEREKTLSKESALYTAKRIEAENYRKQQEREQNTIDDLKRQIIQKEADLQALQPTDRDVIIRENAEEYKRQKQLLEEVYKKDCVYRTAMQELSQVKHELQQISALYTADVKSMQISEEGLKKKSELLLSVECVDISNAKCGFLADAVFAKRELEGYPERYAKRKVEYEAQIAPINQKITALEQQLKNMNYDSGEVAAVSKRIDELKPYEAQLVALNQRESQISLIQANLDNMKSNILEAEKRLAEVTIRGMEAAQERDRYAKSFEEHADIQNTILMLKPWIEKEKQLPVAEERKATAMSRVLELSLLLADIETGISEKKAEAARENEVTNSIEELKDSVCQLNSEINNINVIIREKQMEVGAFRQKLEQITVLQKNIEEIQEKQVAYAKETADFDILKVAFSQNGVPHQIIRSMIPKLTTISNTILGQMTGGKMGVEFRLEKLQKNGKEKTSLDIFIEENGKPALPYLSKSGGEKVKSSLSVILALAEIKSCAAGIQLGMLFIDEPPFLDSDGVDAYCDALETIQSRYKNIKIMAITHDLAMKARFPQNLDVVKTEHGSKVVY